jgi:aspartate aminotransferase-like enzyme
LANEAMIWQIKMLQKKGLILSNGEFGERLLNQASINKLDFVSYKIEWGKAFSQQEIEKVIAINDVHWILFCHCETSTGVINNMNSIVDAASRNNIKCYADCISSVGCLPVDLSRLSMGTASSGKGLGSIAGLAVIFSNEQVFSDGTIPNYIDLECYAEKDGIPFTISSNLVKLQKQTTG